MTASRPTKLIINADICDARRVREENYAMYEAIIINSSLMIVNEQSKGILNRLGISINSDNTLELPDGEELDPVVQTITGPFTISAGMTFAPHTMLNITGPLTIDKDTGDVMKNIDKITLTGPLLRPQSLGGRIPPLVHSGPTTVYPDDCTLLDKNFTVDAYFALRARQGARYFAARQIIFDPQADLQQLVDKQVFFRTDKLILHESQAPLVAQITDERATFRVIPDGMRYYEDDITLDEAFLRSNGGSLYVDGDLTFAPEADGDLLCRLIEQLWVQGKITIMKAQEPAFRGLRSVTYGELEILDQKGRHRIVDQAQLFLDRQTLEQYPEGVEISDVATLTIDPEIPVELIYERLTIDDVALIRCSTVQAGAIGAVSHDVASVRGVPAEEVVRRPQDSGLIGGLMRGLFGTPDWGEESAPAEEDESPADAPAQDTPGIRLINADRYIL